MLIKIVKIKFDSNDNVPLNILVNIHTLVLSVRYQRVQCLLV